VSRIAEEVVVDLDGEKRERDYQVWMCWMSHRGHRHQHRSKVEVLFIVAVTTRDALGTADGGFELNW
jgi:hypothetical protein